MADGGRSMSQRGEVHPLINWEARARILDVENELLRAENCRLREQIGLAAKHPLMFDLTRSEAAMFGLLLANRAPRKETFMTALYALNSDDPPEIKIIDVFICKMRKKLRPFGIEINTNWGESCEIPETSKARARELMEAA
jgi:two-component system cell cycle response regulator CtrA